MAKKITQTIQSEKVLCLYGAGVTIRTIALTLEMTEDKVWEVLDSNYIKKAHDILKQKGLE